MSEVVGNWSIPLPRPYVRREVGNAVVFDDGTRLVEVSAYTFEFEDMSKEDQANVVKMFTENFRAQGPDDQNCDFDRNKLRGRGVIRQEDDDDELSYWFLRGCLTDGIDACNVAIRFNELSDRPWAIDLFESIRLNNPWAD
jgi:hypothetical protein